MVIIGSDKFIYWRDNMHARVIKPEIFLFFGLFLIGCSGIGVDSAPVDEPLSPPPVSTENISDQPVFSGPPIASATLLDAVKVTPTSNLNTTSEHEGMCRSPIDKYARVEINGHLVSERTLHMLEYAYQLYGGVIDIRGPAITQGHYTSSELLSFGTHAGGGVVDISVIDHSTWKVLYEEIDPLIQALRIAGFAAWLRDYDELSSGSPIHIHAVAIGDQELSLAATNQLTGHFGYFRGYNGLPMEDDIPVIDLHGGPIICYWMMEDGYSDMSDK